MAPQQSQRGSGRCVRVLSGSDFSSGASTSVSSSNPNEQSRRRVITLTIGMLNTNSATKAKNAMNRHPKPTITRNDQKLTGI